jgi:hypothetical protein
VLRRWLQRIGSSSSQELTIDDLVVLGRFDEAERRLLVQLKAAPNDRHARGRLGEVLALMGRHAEAVDHYLHTADAYLDDGFLDKAAALLVKANKLQPDNSVVSARLHRVEDSRLVQQVRREALEGLREGVVSRGGRPTLELETVWNRVEDSDFPRHFPATQARRFCAQLELIKLATGEVLHRPGDPGSELYLVGPGEIEVVLETPHGATDVGLYSNGDMFGESRLLSQRPWPALYRATKPTSLFRLDRAGLERALHGNPDPRTLLDVLRSQRRDAILEEMLQQIRR